MSSVAQRCLLWVVLFKTRMIWQTLFDARKMCNVDVDEDSLRQQFWTSPNWISFFHIQTARSYLWHCQWCSQGNCVPLCPILVFSGKKKKTRIFLSRLRDDGTRMIDENNKRWRSLFYLFFFVNAWQCVKRSYFHATSSDALWKWGEEITRQTRQSSTYKAAFCCRQRWSY